MQARIAYLINSVEGGGAALPVPEVARVLQGCGAQVRVFALTRRDGLALPAMEAAGLEPVVRDGGEKDHLAAFRWLRAEVRAWGATHLWTSLSRATILGLLAGPGLGVPVIAWQHAAFLKPWNERLLRWLQPRARLWVADSRSVAQLTRDRLRVPAGRLEAWPIFAADPSMPVASPWEPGMPLHIGSLGRLHPVKGYDVLIEAFAHMRRDGFVPPVPLLFTIGGEGAERRRLQSLAREHQMPLALPGFHSKPRPFLARQHLYVQPSRSEGFCLSVHEAMTAGLPVIASRVGEPSQTIQHGTTGWLSTPGSPKDLASGLRQALASPEHLAAIGLAARAAVLDRFSQARFEQTGQTIWQRVVSAAGPARS